MLGYHRQARILGRNTRLRQRNSRGGTAGSFTPFVAFSPSHPYPLQTVVLQGINDHRMKILVVGGGAREHALAWKLAGERGVRDVICAPGNPGIAEHARCMPAEASDPRTLLDVAARESVDLTIVGPELPLSLGIADLFAAERRAI